MGYNIWSLCVKTNTESFQLVLNELFVCHGLHGIQHNHNQVACSSDSNNLSTTTLTILSTLNNSWKIQQLQ